MRRSLSANELALFRARPQSARLFLAVHQPPVVFQAVLSKTPHVLPGSVLRYTGITSGAITAVSPGMTLLIGSSAGASNYGSLRIRASATSPVIRTAEYGSGLLRLPSGACLTILEEFRPWPIHPSYDAATSLWQVDFDPYTLQHQRYGPLALLGPAAVGFMEGASKMAACYVGDMSYSLTPGISVTSQRWEFPDGTIVTSALGTSLNPIQITYLNASPGGRYHSLTVTDSQGGSHVGRRLTFAFGSGANQPPRAGFESITGGLRQGGYQTKINVYGSAASQNFPEGAYAVLFESASYGTSGGSSIGGNFPFRNNVVMAGWIEQESLRISPFTGQISFNLRTIDGILDKTDSQDLFLQGGNLAGQTNASDWDMAASLSMDRAAIALTKYRSTIANVTDVNLASGLYMSAEINRQFQSVSRGSLWAQLKQNYFENGMLGLVAADLQSSIYCQTDVQVDGGSATLPVTARIDKPDRRGDVTLDHDYQDKISAQLLYAEMGGSPIGAISPGYPTGYFGGQKETARGLAACSQDILITWAGNVRAAENNPFKRITVPLAGNLRLDSVPQTRLQMSLSAVDNVRGISFDNDDFLPYETSLRYDAKTGTILTDLVIEKIVNGNGGSSLTLPASAVGSYPITPPPPLPPLPIIPPPDIKPPPAGENGNNMFGLAIISGGTGIIAGTANFLNVSPTWADVSGSGATRVTGNLLVFRLDPWAPANNAYCLTSDGLWYTTTIRNSPPTWTNILTAAQMQSGTGDGSASFSDEALIMSPNVSGYAGLIARNGNSIYFGRTSNAPGGSGTWLWTLVQSNSLYRAFWVSQHTINNIFVVTYNPGLATIWYSTSGGASFSSNVIPVSPATFGMSANASMFIPYLSTTDKLIYVSSEGDQGDGFSGGKVFRTTTGAGGTWSDISPLSSDSRKMGSYSPEAMTESPISDGSNLFLMAYAGAVTDENRLFKYSGSSWTTIAGPNTDARWKGDGFGGWPSNNTQLQAHNVGFGLGHIGRSIDGGATWVDRTGNLLTIQAATIMVRFLTPIWTVV